MSIFSRKAVHTPKHRKNDISKVRLGIALKEMAEMSDAEFRAKYDLPPAKPREYCRHDEQIAATNMITAAAVMAAT